MPLSFISISLSTVHSYLQMPSILVLLQAWIWSLLSPVSIGRVSDINSLRSIKDSLEDPYGYLNATWDFSNIQRASSAGLQGLDAGTMMKTKC
ncbi:hypothetical protein SLA2020_193700 [Shorea laevis]